MLTMIALYILLGFKPEPNGHIQRVFLSPYGFYFGESGPRKFWNARMFFIVTPGFVAGYYPHLAHKHRGR